MKFTIIVVVVFVLTISVQALELPIALSISSPAIHGPAIAVAELPAVTAHAVSIPAAVQLDTPRVLVRAPVVVAAEGTYVAQNRGAVHIAPLPGHVNSAASVNLEPAPGTY